MDKKDLAYIIEKHTRIILPDFGAFLLKESNSEFFKPENITFSPFLKYNDGVLEEFYAKYKGITKEEAIKQIKSFIDTLKETIRAEGYFHIDGVGRLSRDSRGAIVFSVEGKTNEAVNEANQTVDKPKKSTKSKKTSTAKPENENNIELLANAENNAVEENLMEIDSSTKTDNLNDGSTDLEKIPLDENTYQVEVDETTIEIEHESEAIVGEPEIANDEDMAKSNKKSKLSVLLIYLGVSLGVILVLAFLIRIVAFDNEIESTKQQVTQSKPSVQSTTPDAEETSKTSPKDEMDKAFDAMTSNEKSDSSVVNSAESNIEAQIEKSVIENAAIQNNSSEKYYLVVGSFKDKSNAEKYAKQLKTEGYSSEVLSLPNGKNYVSVGSYTTKEKANQQKMDLTKKFPSIWILKK